MRALAKGGLGPARACLFPQGVIDLKERWEAIWFGEELYEMVWSMPMIKVAKQFNVSGSYMARVCSAFASHARSEGTGLNLLSEERTRSLRCQRHNRATNSVGPGTESCCRRLDSDL